MAIVKFNGSLYVPSLQNRPLLVPAVANSVLDAADEFCGAVVSVPKTGTLTHIGMRLGPVSTFNASSRCRVSLETLDISSGTARPSGTLYAVNAEGQIALDINADDNAAKFIPLNSGSGVNVTRGDNAAIKISYGVFNAGDFFQVSIGITNYGYSGFPYVFSYLGGVWTYVYTQVPNFVFKYDDGTIITPHGCLPAVSVASNGFSQSSNPNHRGLRFKLPISMSINSLMNLMDIDASANLILFNADGVTAMATIALSPELRSVNSTTPYKLPTLGDITLNANTYYRLVLVPTTAALIYFVTLSPAYDGVAAATSPLEFGSDFHYTSCNGTPTQESSWTNDLNLIPVGMGIGINGIGSGTGGGAVGPFGTIR